MNQLHRYAFFFCFVVLFFELLKTFRVTPKTLPLGYLSKVGQPMICIKTILGASFPILEREAFANGIYRFPNSFSNKDNFFFSVLHSFRYTAFSEPSLYAFISFRTHSLSGKSPRNRRQPFPAMTGIVQRMISSSRCIRAIPLMMLAVVALAAMK